MDIETTLVANAGLLLKVGQIKILIDALHVGNDGAFSPPSPSTLVKIIEGLSPFDNISYLFITHYHLDHFNPDFVLKYLGRHDLKGVFLPQEALDIYPSFFTHPLLSKSNVHMLKLSDGEKRSYNLEDKISFSCFKSSHMPQNIYEDMVNYCYLFYFGGRTVLVPGDANYDLGFFRNMLIGSNIHVFFANPLFINKLEGRKILQELEPELIVFYHIPFEQDDDIFFRQVVRQGCRKYADILPETVVLQDEMQSFLL